MADINNANKLFHNATSFTSSQLWSDEITDGTVTISTGIAHIQYALPSSLAGYYTSVYNAHSVDEYEAYAGAFVQITNSTLIADIDHILGNSGSATGYVACTRFR